MCHNLLQLKNDKWSEVQLLILKTTNKARNPGVIMDTELNLKAIENDYKISLLSP